MIKASCICIRWGKGAYMYNVYFSFFPPSANSSVCFLHFSWRRQKQQQQQQKKTKKTKKTTKKQKTKKTKKKKKTNKLTRVLQALKLGHLNILTLLAWFVKYLRASVREPKPRAPGLYGKLLHVDKLSVQTHEPYSNLHIALLLICVLCITK